MEIYIPVISKGFQHQFWQAVKQGAEQAAEDCGVEITFEGPETEAMVDKQLEMLQTALDKKPDAIAFAALDSKAAIPLLERAQEEGIPVIGFDSGVDSDIPVTTAATDNIAAAAHGCRQDGRVDRRRGPGGRDRARPDQPHRHRPRDGFPNRMEEEYPDIEIVDVQYGGGDQLKSTDLAKAIILAHPDLKGFFGANEGSIIGVLNAVKELGMEGDLVVIGYDSGQQQMEASARALRRAPSRRTRSASATRRLRPPSWRCAAKSWKKRSTPASTGTTRSNIDDEEIVALLYE